MKGETHNVNSPRRSPCKGCWVIRILRIPSVTDRLANQSEQVAQALLLGGDRTSILVIDPLREVSLWLSRRSRSGSSSGSRFCRSRSRCTAVADSVVAAGIASTAGVASDFAARIDDVVSTLTQSLLSLTADTAVAVSQRHGQSFHNALRAAALVLAELIADFICCLGPNAFIRIVQGVDEGRHDFRIADAIVLVAELRDGSTTLTGVAGSLRFVNQLSDLASVLAGSGAAAVADASITGTSVARTGVACTARSGAVIGSGTGISVAARSSTVPCTVHTAIAARSGTVASTGSDTGVSAGAVASTIVTASSVGTRSGAIPGTVVAAIACSARAAAIGGSATSIATRGFRAGPLIVVDIPVTGPNDRRLAA